MWEVLKSVCPESFKVKCVLVEILPIVQRFNDGRVGIEIYKSLAMTMLTGATQLPGRDNASRSPYRYKFKTNMADGFAPRFSVATCSH